MKRQEFIEHKTINTKSIIFGMLVVFIIVHIGFGATYIKEFPEFEKFNWLHHLHGALMGAWVLLLVAQPFLIHFKKFATHRLLGKLSYVLAPCMLVSMVCIARHNYETGIIAKPATEVMAVQSITWMQIAMFALFYALAIFNKKNTHHHMRFMIGTAIVMLGPPMGRIILSLITHGPSMFVFLIPLYVKTGIAAGFLITDISKNKNWKANLIVFSAFLFSDIVFHARYSYAWQAVGKFIVNTFY